MRITEFKKGECVQYEITQSQAENIARYIISRLPEDCIPYWDYDAPNIPNAL